MTTIVKLNRYFRNNREEVISHLAILSFMASTLVLFSVLAL